MASRGVRAGRGGAGPTCRGLSFPAWLGGALTHPARLLAGLWSFLWFVGFCFLTNQWQRTAPDPGTVQAGDAARAAIAFSFFSILSWVSAGAGPGPGRGQGRVVTS